MITWITNPKAVPSVDKTQRYYEEGISSMSKRCLVIWKFKDKNKVEEPRTATYSHPTKVNKKMEGRWVVEGVFGDTEVLAWTNINIPKHLQ